MKTSQIHLSGYAGAVLIALLLTTSTVQAQTFRKSNRLTETPKTFDALLFPVETRPQTIRINFDNPDRKLVRVIIQHESGAVVYDQYKTAATSREYYNLSSLPAGNYVVNLSAGRDRISKPFTIEPNRAGYVTMGNRPMPVIGEFPTRGELVSNN